MGATQDFGVFWEQYPRKIGKLAAEKAYTKARRLATPEQILAGVELYKRTKPPYADWCHAATWLNQGRWMDEPDAAVTRQLRSVTKATDDWRCQHTPPCPNPSWHQVMLARERGQVV